MGTAFGPIGAFLPELFDANVRYSGSGIGYNLAAIVGAAFVPTIATWLSHHWGVHSVGLYLGVMAVCQYKENGTRTVPQERRCDFSDTIRGE